MPTSRRTFDRTLVAKLSDARERLHALVARADAERAREAAAVVTWPHDMNDEATEAEVPRG